MNQKEIPYTQEEVFIYLVMSRNKKEFVQHFGYKDSRSADKICKRFNLNINDLGKISGKTGEPLKNGQIFGKLTVIDANCGKLGGKKPETASLCRCTCGEELMVKNDFLKRGHTQSCGCLNGTNKSHLIKAGDIFNELVVLEANIFLDEHND